MSNQPPPEILGVLKTSVDVRRVAVFAEMAFVEEQPDMKLACQYYASGQDSAADSLLEPLSETARGNLQQHMETVGLLDDGALTPLGHDVAEDGMVPVPEQGVYQLWLVDHPLSGPRILHAERVPTRYNDRDFDERESLSASIPNGAYRSVVDGQRLVLRQLLDRRNGSVQGRVMETDSCELWWSLQLKPDGSWENKWWFHGRLAQAGPAQTDDDLFKESVEGIGWHGLIDGWMRRGAIGEWDSEHGRLSVRVDDLEPKERHSFVREKIHLADVEVPRFGTWEQAGFGNVPLQPASDHDAERWAQALLEDHLEGRDYVTGRDIDDSFEDIVAGTPLERFEPSRPEHRELVASLENARRYPTYWHVAAPHDLAPQSARPQ